jgi:hypothetical protein
MGNAQIAFIVLVVVLLPKNHDYRYLQDVLVGSALPDSKSSIVSKKSSLDRRIFCFKLISKHVIAVLDQKLPAAFKAFNRSKVLNQSIFKCKK